MRSTPIQVLIPVPILVQFPNQDAYCLRVQMEGAPQDIVMLPGRQSAHGGTTTRARAVSNRSERWHAVAPFHGKVVMIVTKDPVVKSFHLLRRHRG